MIPDFDRNIIDTVAKRAGFICSNPDCRAKTVGPNTDVNKSIVIGEVAHIYGARPAAKRYKEDMTDAARGEITNAIWLCRNCHKIIDSDDKKFSSETLFRWRELHEQFVSSELGNKSDLIAHEQESVLLNQFIEYPFIVKRIVIDKPLGWEYRLTAELMRHVNAAPLRKLRDLQNNLYVKTRQHIAEADARNWIDLKLTEISKLTTPLVNLIDKLNRSWGPSGQPGDIHEIHHTCLLIRDYLEQIIQHEEQLYFTNLPARYEKLRMLLTDLVGSQALKIESIPEKMDRFVTAINAVVSSPETNPGPIRLEETLVFETPETWESEFKKELRKVDSAGEEGDSTGCFLYVFLIGSGLILFYLIYSWIF